MFSIGQRVAYRREASVDFIIGQMVDDRVALARVDGSRVTPWVLISRLDAERQLVNRGCQEMNVFEPAPERSHPLMMAEWQPFYREEMGADPFRRFYFYGMDLHLSMPFDINQSVKKSATVGIRLRRDLCEWLNSNAPGWSFASHQTKWASNILTSSPQTRKHFPVIVFHNDVDFLAFALVKSRFGLCDKSEFQGPESRY